MEQYIVKREYRAQWNTEQNIANDALWIVTDAEIDRLASEWDIDKDLLLDQVQDKESFISDLQDSKYQYTEYCDDINRYKLETAHNDRIDSIIDAIRMEA